MTLAEYNLMMACLTRQNTLLERIANAIDADKRPQFDPGQVIPLAAPTGYLYSPNLLTMEISPPGLWQRLENGHPRRNDMNHWIPAERKLYDLVHYVETLGAHKYLTDAVILLGEARAKIADWVEVEDRQAMDGG